MLLIKKGLPQEDELVLCTVTAIQYHSVFVTLDEYGGRTAMIHISEIAPGRIRNIRDFVKESKKVVCLVLRINKEKGHVDLSLRRVNESQKRSKLNEIKQEQLSESIVVNVAKQLKLDPEKIYSSLTHKLLQECPTVYDAFEEISKGNLKLAKLGIEKKLSKLLTEIITQRIKPQQIELKGTFLLSSYASDGVERIKNILTKAQIKETKITYAGAGIYNLRLIAEDYKKGESVLKKVIDTALNEAKKLDVKAEFKQ